MNGNAITERQQQLLRTLVGLYIREGQPVGSRTLVQESGIAVSPATVRSIMADLEERGFVTTPHTSAGRVPTSKGYRLFIDTLITMKPLLGVELQVLRAQLDPDKSTTELLAATSNLLSLITHQAGLVTMPRQEDVSLRHVEFLPLAGCRVLVILVLNEKECRTASSIPSASTTRSSCGPPRITSTAALPGWGWGVFARICSPRCAIREIPSMPCSRQR